MKINNKYFGLVIYFHVLYLFKKEGITFEDTNIVIVTIVI
jgi:hypothetical protein